MHAFKIIPILMIFCCQPAAMKAQNLVSDITGTVSDDDGQPIPGANVLLLNPVDSAYITGTTTDTEGKFLIPKIAYGHYLLKISFLGYEIPVLSCIAREKIVELPPVSLKENTYEIASVTVVGKNRPIKFEPGKMVVDVSSSLAASEGNVFEVLKGMPGVTIRENGTVSLNGQSGAKIMVDGKPTYVSGESLVSLLRGMPATSVDKVELITQPDARYDASGTAGIIDIKTKKRKTEGFNLSVNARYARNRYNLGNAGFNLAYRKNKINLFSNYSYYQGKNYNDLRIINDYLDPITGEPTGITLEQNTDRSWRYKTHYFRIGTDYDLTDKITLGVYATGNLSDERLTGKTDSEFSSFGNRSDSALSTRNLNEKYPRRYTGGAYISWKPKTDTEWNTSFDRVYHHHPEDQQQYEDFRNVSTGVLPSDTLRGDIDGIIDIYAGETSITLPLSRKIKLNAGAKSSFIRIDNSASYARRANNAWVENTGLSNDFGYNENVNAGYVQTKIDFSDAFAGQIGLRVENTHVEGNVFEYSSGKDSLFRNRYTDFFPALGLNYNFDNDNGISFTYGRRITRPNYRDMNPFVFVFNKYLHEQGNPNLKPALSDNVELAFTLKKLLRIGLFFTYVKDPITKSFLFRDENVVIVFPENLSSGISYGIRLNTADLDITGWWQANLTFAGQYREFRWNLNGEKEGNDFLVPSGDFNNRFKLSKSWLIELKTSYTGKRAEGQYIFEPMWLFSGGIRKYILNNKGSVTLYVDDIFSTFVVGEISRLGQFTRTREKENGRQISISFSYRFNTGSETKKSRTKSDIDESKRINLR